MTDYRAASDTRLMGPWPVLIAEPLWDWSRDARVLAARARELVANDAFAQAMVAAKLSGTHGPTGLVPRSLAYHEHGQQVSDRERELRRTIERGLLAMSGRAIDAGGMLSRKELDLHIDHLATVDGEGWGVRAWKPDRVHAELATCWRLVRPERICNPDDKLNSDRLYQGLELDADGAVVAIHVKTGTVNAYGVIDKPSWQRIPWYADDGTPNVVHRKGLSVPGMLRGISMFTPALMLLKQIAGTIEAHVTAKRAQACNPIIHFVEDPEEAARKANVNAADATLSPRIRLNPLQILFARIGEQVQFSDAKFNGQDLQMFLEQMHRLLCASWQLPMEVVLAQMGKATLSSSRAGLDQFDRTCQGWQDDHIRQVAQPIDASLIAEMAARGIVTAGRAGLTGLCAARYSRPPKYSTDRLKDAQTMAEWLANGRSYTAVFDAFGFVFEDEVEERKRDEEFLAANGVTLAPPTAKPPAPEPKDDKKPADDGENQGGADSAPANQDA